MEKTAFVGGLLIDGTGRPPVTDSLVLVEEKNEQDDSLVTGRMSNNTIVHFPGGEDLIGTLAEVHLDECHGFYYTGTVENKR